MVLLKPLTMLRAAAALAFVVVLFTSLTSASADHVGTTTTHGTPTGTATRTATPIVGTYPVVGQTTSVGQTPSGAPTGGLSSAAVTDPNAAQVSGIIVGMDTTTLPARILVQSDTATPPTYATDPALMPGATLVYVTDPAILPGLGLGMNVTFGGGQPPSPDPLNPLQAFMAN